MTTQKQLTHEIPLNLTFTTVKCVKGRPKQKEGSEPFDSLLFSTIEIASRARNLSCQVSRLAYGRSPAHLPKPSNKDFSFIGPSDDYQF